MLDLVNLFKEKNCSMKVPSSTFACRKFFEILISNYFEFGSNISKFLFNTRMFEKIMLVFFGGIESRV